MRAQEDVGGDWLGSIPSGTTFLSFFLSSMVLASLHRISSYTSTIHHNPRHFCIVDVAAGHYAAKEECLWIVCILRPSNRLPCALCWWPEDLDLILAACLAWSMEAGPAPCWFQDESADGHLTLRVW
ncbi:hypothetical protein P170DRAFT_58672 [Aspergillus steynii IBT 23096]|uniref:Uncharacterized protein n=1 Tax=Aspergillus steynii IBT 23096 TaxID=1392250 RepID=A0A2I2FSP3_9EURO|nr:uncharacterized protein P170DRAFT_58672 [Aspergillus steynii IBT 23096]PLB43639.1 hypothetical protein P170DRAFT_58672 [Aspergillus steynii IBT 23096]